MFEMLIDFLNELHYCYVKDPMYPVVEIDYGVCKSVIHYNSMSNDCRVIMFSPYGNCA